jgi:hypothetical protein
MIRLMFASCREENGVQSVMNIRRAVLVPSLMLITSPAWACGLCGLEAPADQLAHADVFFTGTVVGLTLLDGPRPVVRVELNVTELFKGTTPDRLVIFANADPRPTFVARVDPATGALTIGGGFAGESCQASEIFALDKDYVVQAFNNRPEFFGHVAVGEASIVTTPCHRHEVTSENGRRVIAGLRRLLR